VGTRRKYYIPHYKNQRAHLTPNAIFCSTLSNPNVSEEAKQNAQAMLNELGGDQPREELYQARGDQNKDPMRVSAGLKA
jgi:hypothetical protein